MRAMWVGVSFLTLSGCWFWEECADDVGGIKEGQLLETTVVAPFEREGDWQPSCGDLGDLPPGTRVTWRADLHGSAETCDDQLRVNVRSHSSAQLSVGDSSNPPAIITLPGGCFGSWYLQIEPLANERSFLGPVDAKAPSWVLRRVFNASPDAPVCPSEVASRSSCADSFIAETRVVDAE